MEPSCFDVDDIEDLGTKADEVRDSNGRSDVIVRVKSRKSQLEETVKADSIIPGTQTVWIHTWGCAHNSSDSEYMAGLLGREGYKIITGLSGVPGGPAATATADKSKSVENCNTNCCGDKPDGTAECCKTKDKVCVTSYQKGDRFQADLWLLNSCTVKQPAEDHFRNLVMQAKKSEKYLVVAGCVPQGQPKADYLKGVSVVGVHQIDRVVEVVEEALKGNTVRLLGKKRVNGKQLGGASLELPKIRRNPLIEILPINTGCLNACTYCKTKHARGELGSYPPQEIIDRAKQAFTEGCVEVWLTSEDLGAYGRDLGITLPVLLHELVKVIPPGCMLRMGMTNPPYILEHLNDIAIVLNHPRVYAFLHLPVQSGSDAVLGEMRREYTRADFCRVVDFLKSRVPGLTIATDIICGFPTETDEDFEETHSLVDKYKFPVLFVNQFFARPGTPAAKMHRVASTSEVKNRTRRMHDLFHSYQSYQGRERCRMRVLVTEESHDKLHWVAHNKAYEQILVPKEEGLLGRLLEVEVIEVGKHFMKARIINRNPDQSLPVTLGTSSQEAKSLWFTSTLNTYTKSWHLQVGLTILVLWIALRLSNTLLSFI